jgi:hypothetical protein
MLVIAPLAFGQQGNITGSVVDAIGASVRGALVRLSLDGRAPDQETRSAESGDF